MLKSQWRISDHSCPLSVQFLPPANEVCEGYVFIRVCHSVHRGVSAPGGGMSAPAGCLLPEGCLLPGGSPGPHQGVSRPTPRGSPCRPPAPPSMTATAACGTHPTEMHPFFHSVNFFFIFMQFSVKIIPNNRLATSSGVPPPGNPGSTTKSVC